MNVIRRLLAPAEPAWETPEGGICFPVGLPRFGRQDMGVSPGGAQDLFSFLRGNILLRNGAGMPALEIIHQPAVRFRLPALIALTGAQRPARLGPPGREVEIAFNRVYEAAAGERLLLGARRYGLRTYLCCRPAPTALTRWHRSPLQLDFRPFSAWVDPEGCIRVLPGPEWSWLDDPQEFLDRHWTVSPEMDRMGMRLEGPARLACRTTNMISAAVADGTVQLTPKGPIVLLRHRQTTGGYPRIANVISADIDRLAQYAVREVIRFRLVDEAEARAAAQARLEALRRMRRLVRRSLWHRIPDPEV